MKKLRKLKFAALLLIALTASASNYPMPAPGTNGNVLTAASGKWTSALASGGGGTKNYLSGDDTNFNASVGNVVAYADAAGTSPVDGTAGSPTLTCTRTTTNPLSGAGSLLITKDAANRQGNGCSVGFTIDRADLAKPLTISFDYEVKSGTYDAGSSTTDSDLTAWVYGPTDGTAVVTQLAPYKILGATSGTTMRFMGQMQTASSGVAYRLILHEAKTGTSAYTVAVDSLSVSPTYASYGAVADDLSNTRTFTPVNFGTVTSADVRSQRIGDRLRVTGKFVAATVVGSTASITLPVSIDSNKLASGVAVLVGRAYRGTASTAFAGSGSGPYPVFYDGSTTGSVFFANAASSSVLAKATGSGLMSSGEALYYEFDIPVSGWSSNVLVSDSAETREVSAIISGDAASATSGNPIIVPTATWDSHAGYTAASGRYTCPVPGRYKMFGAGQSASSATTLTIYKNAVSTQLAGNLDSNGEATFAGMVNCLAGDLIDIRPGGTVDFTNVTLNIERVSGPAQIAASERVYAFYTGNGGTALTANTTNIDYLTKVQDSHNAFSGATFTAPRAGWYNVLGSAFTTAGVTATLSFYVNATIKQALGSGASARVFPIGFGFYLQAGDALTIRSDTNATLSNSSTLHWISISSQSGA